MRHKTFWRELCVHTCPIWYQGSFVVSRPWLVGTIIFKFVFMSISQWCMTRVWIDYIRFHHHSTWVFELLEFMCIWIHTRCGVDQGMHKSIYNDFESSLYKAFHHFCHGQSQECQLDFMELISKCYHKWKYLVFIRHFTIRIVPM